MLNSINAMELKFNLQHKPHAVTYGNSFARLKDKEVSFAVLSSELHRISSKACIHRNLLLYSRLYVGALNCYTSTVALGPRIYFFYFEAIVFSNNSSSSNRIRFMRFSSGYRLLNFCWITST